MKSVPNCWEAFRELSDGWIDLSMMAFRHRMSLSSDSVEEEDSSYPFKALEHTANRLWELRRCVFGSSAPVSSKFKINFIFPNRFHVS
jgi:hypothetical protein